MRTNNMIQFPQNKSIVFEEKSTYTIDIKNIKCKKNIAVVNCIFAPDGSESLDKILEKWIKAIDLND